LTLQQQPYAGQADTRPSAVPYAEPDGWVLFAAILILINGVFNGFDGLVGFFRASYFVGSPTFGSLWIWALLWLAFGVLQVLAGLAIMAGQGWARWFGIVTVGLNAVVQMFAIAAYPWWSLIIITIDVLIIYALTAHWRRAPVALG
jgi:hypothetical protein